MRNEIKALFKCIQLSKKNSNFCDRIIIQIDCGVISRIFLMFEGVFYHINNKVLMQLPIWFMFIENSR